MSVGTPENEDEPIFEPVEPIKRGRDAMEDDDYDF
jgi:hypothetical protein